LVVAKAHIRQPSRAQSAAELPVSSLLLKNQTLN
jgi:hypothetical protein